MLKTGLVMVNWKFLSYKYQTNNNTIQYIRYQQHIFFHAINRRIYLMSVSMIFIYVNINKFITYISSPNLCIPCVWTHIHIQALQSDHLFPSNDKHTTCSGTCSHVQVCKTNKYLMWSNISYYCYITPAKNKNKGPTANVTTNRNIST